MRFPESFRYRAGSASVTNLILSCVRELRVRVTTSIGQAVLPGMWNPACGESSGWLSSPLGAGVRECAEKYGSVFDKCLLYGGDCDFAAVQQIFLKLGKGLH